MIPTNYLRWHRSKQVAFEGGAATLQQWWMPEVYAGYPRTDNPAGEWRDVETVEEA